MNADQRRRVKRHVEPADSGRWTARPEYPHKPGTMRRLYARALARIKAGCQSESDLSYYDSPDCWAR